LRQFIEAGFPQEFTYPRYSRVIGSFEIRPAQLVQVRVLLLKSFGISYHCTEFIHLEALAPLTGAELRKQNRLSIIKPD
jgi:hypothetical protein